MPIARYQSQGTLDGMCGQYALVNALTACGVLTTYAQQQDVLATMNEALPRGHWPASVTVGTSFEDIQKMIRAAKRKHRGPRRLKVTFPFEEGCRPKRAAQAYLEQLLELLPAASCAILPVQRPDDAWVDHWIVVQRRGRAFQFIDSVKQDGKTTITKTIAGLRVGRHRGDDNNWHILAKEQVMVLIK